MKKREPISKIMTSSVFSLKKGDDLFAAEEMFKKHKIRHLPVLENGQIVGILSQTDLARISFVDNFGGDEGDVDTAVYNMLTLDQVMKQKPITIQTNQTIREAAEILSKNEFHALPVVEEGKLVGIVTTTDLINFLLEQY